jgi:hypothetical protein
MLYRTNTYTRVHLIAKLLSRSKWNNIEAETEGGSGKPGNETHITHMTFSNFIDEYGFSMLMSFNNVIIIIKNIYFPEPFSVCLSLFILNSTTILQLVVYEIQSRNPC